MSAHTEDGFPTTPPALHFPGGARAKPAPTRAQLESSAAEWFDQALSAMLEASQLMAAGAFSDARIQLAHNERCSARARAYIEQAAQLPEARA